MGLGVSRQNRSAMRELTGELRDEGDEGAGRRAREKKKIEEERRETGERERKKICLFNERRERSVIIFFFFLSFKLQYVVKNSCVL